MGYALKSSINSFCVFQFPRRCGPADRQLMNLYLLVGLLLVLSACHLIIFLEIIVVVFVFQFMYF